MFGTVTSWLGGTKPSDDDDKQTQSSTEKVENLDKNLEVNQSADHVDNVVPVDDNTKKESPDGEDSGDLPDLNEVSTKAINTAKVWGSYLFNVGKAATKTVTETALQLKEKAPLIGDFQKEQERFMIEKKEKKRQAEAAVPPWVGYNEEEVMKEQILALSLDKRNFLRNPPAGVQFVFDFEASFPIAMATLQEDKNLSKMRFDLVPKLVGEECFWRNYFYRVSLIKQSTQLTTLAQQTGTSGEGSSKSNESSRRSSLDNGQKGDSSSASSSDYDKLTDIQEHRTDMGLEKLNKPEEIPTGTSPPDNEFISDTFQDDNISEEEIRKEMMMLGMSEKDTTNIEDDENLPEWEQEIQKELQEYEMVDDGTDDADIENEILEQLKQEYQGT